MSFGARLAEERKRLGLKQAEFVARVGSDVPKQSLYENNQRSLRADYLSRIAAAGVDVVYVITGKRNEGAILDAEATALFDAYFRLTPEARSAIAEFATQLARYPGRPADKPADEGSR